MSQNQIFFVTLQIKTNRIIKTIQKWIIINKKLKIK